MKYKITERDVKCIILGFISFFVLSVMVDWDTHVAAFKEGFEEGRSSNILVLDQDPENSISLTHKK